MQKKNINLLWDIIISIENFKFLSKTLQNDVQQYFLQNISTFLFNDQQNTYSLIDLNKKYISFISSYIKKLYPHKTNKIKILNEPITQKDFHATKMNQFERDLQQKQAEFTNIIKTVVPPKPDFLDVNNDKPIENIEDLLKNITAQRNYDNTIFNQQQNNTQSQNIQSQNIQSQNIQSQNIQSQNTQSQNIQSQNIQSQNNETQNQNKKNISWSLEEEIIPNKQDNILLNFEDNFLDNTNKIQNERENIFDLKFEIQNLNNKLNNINIQINEIYNIIKNKIQ